MKQVYRGTCHGLLEHESENEVQRDGHTGRRERIRQLGSHVIDVIRTRRHR